MNLFEGEGFRDAESVLQAELSSNSRGRTYIHRLASIYGASPWLEYINNMANLVEPIDRDLGMDPDYSTGQAFFSGAIVGFHVVRLCVPERVRTRMMNVVVFNDNEDPDPLEMTHRVGASLVDMGERGSAEAPELTKIVEAWEPAVTPDVRYQPFVRRGFGVIMYLLAEANREIAEEEHKAGYEAMEQAYMDGVDWDTEFRSLFPGDGEPNA